MPTLKQITCAIELGPGNTRLKEYDHQVTDGAVEVYVVSPETSDIPFHVRVTSDGYVAPGLSAYVFMDGEYQCNRNRLRLRFPEDGASSNEYEIDFKLQQKEEKRADGTFVARDWFFTPLGISTSDKIVNMNNFKDNVGTIEVVVLRCKDGGGEEVCTDPDQTTVSRNPSYPAQAPSMRVPSVHTPSIIRAAPSVKSSGGSFYGGLMAMYDGAGDDPGYYKQYRPLNIVGQEPLPGHKWDPSSGQYRYFNDQDPFVNRRDQDDNRHGGSFPANHYSPQTYTVGGGFSYQESVQPQEERSELAKVFVPQSSPGYDFSARRRKALAKHLDQPPKSTYDFNRTRKHETERLRQERVRPQQASEVSNHREQSVGGLAFIEDCSHRLEDLIGRFASEVEKYNDLKEDARRYYDRKVIHVEILKASQRKYDEIVTIINALGHRYDIVKQAMDAMDRNTWRRASDLFFEKKLYPPPQFEVDPPPGRDEEGKPEVSPSVTASKQDNNWRWAQGEGFEQVGEGTAGDKPQESRRLARGGNSRSQSGKDKEDKADTGWGNVKVEKDTPDDGWGNGDANNSIAVSDKKSETKTAKWESSGTKKADEGWAATKNANAGDDAWGNNNDASKPASVWGGDVNKGASHVNRHEKSSKSHHSGPVNDGARSGSYSLGDRQPKPVIKSYWSEWTKKQVMATPKVQPREVYEYPALPLPVLPLGKADKGITQAVHAGKGVNYAHKLHRPEYLDTMSKPYAIFTFKYRSKSVLEGILKHKVDDGNIGEAKAEMQKHALLGKSKDELIEELMKKTSVATQSRAPTKAASNEINEWGAKDEKVASVKRASSHKISHQKGQTKNDWEDSKTVEPSDSVSQQGGSGWGAPEKPGSKHASNKASHHSQKPETQRGLGLKSGSAWGAAGWGSAVKSAKKAASTVNHFGNDSAMKKTAPNDPKEKVK